MVRKLTTTVVASLLVALLLSGCTLGLSAMLPLAFSPILIESPETVEVAYPNLVDRQAVADYQATLPMVVYVEPAASPAKTFLQINDRQELAEYQATLPVFLDPSEYYQGD
jgi:hypothetical protein